MFNVNFLSNDQKSSASVVDDVLILSLPNAINPVVWRWNLSDAKASALEVREQNDGTCKLILKTPRGDVQDVAPFAEKQQAMRALMAVSHAMESSKSIVKKSTTDIPHNSATPNTKGETTKVFMGLGAIATILVLFIWLQSLAPTRLDNNITNNNTAANASSENGMAVSAEDFLNGF